MTAKPAQGGMSFEEAIEGLGHGDFSRLAPLFEGEPCAILGWLEEGRFEDEPEALNEALTCACFNGTTKVATVLLDRGVDPAAGNKTGLNAFHWAANRGNLKTVKLLVERGAPLEIENMHGGTVLGCTVWSAIHEAKPGQLAVIETLMGAGANVEAVQFPTGNPAVDEILRRNGKPTW